MRFSLRSKLIAIVGVAAGAFIVLIVSSETMARRAESKLETIQRRLLPRLELAPSLEGAFDRLRRGLQDAVAARDLDTLAGTRAQLEEVHHRLEAAPGALDPDLTRAFRQALDSYYDTASTVSRRLIAGETGEALVDAARGMQLSQARAGDALKRLVSFDRGELNAAFEAAAEANATAGRVRLATSLTCLVVVVLLSLWLGRGVLRSLRNLTEGFRRFGQGDFAAAIPIRGNDELGDVARHANLMAQHLKEFGERRDHADWLKRAVAGLGEQLRGELEPADVASRALAFLAPYIDARAAALYAVDAAGALRLLGMFAGAPAGAEAPAPAFRAGEGLVGQAALQQQVIVVDDPPAGYLRIRSGLGEASPRALAFLPLVRFGRVVGVLELATFSPWADRCTEALVAVRDDLAIALEVAQARASMRDLLSETQRQTVRLQEQEEELRRTNLELHAQQEALRERNHELTEQARELEAQRRKLEQNNLELDEARRSLEQKAAELSTVSTYKSRFLTNMSHELRTPLNSMLLLSNLLAENEGRNLTEKQVEFARTINIAGRDLLALINQVLDLSKIEAGKHDIRVGRLDLKRLAATMRLVFDPLARDRGLDLAVEVAPELPAEISTDGQKVEQILKNLLANAIKFTERGGVTLRIERPRPGTPLHEGLSAPRTIAFVVTDTGAGVAAEDRERIFGRFEQVEGASDRRYGGTGLGLSISRELARLLGGELRLDSVLGRGSAFTCLLPEAPAAAAASPSDEPAAVAAASAAAPAAEPAAAPCLLLIEDDHAFAEALAEIVRGQGLRCLIARDGRSGLALAREARPAGIVLDVKLPDIDGWRVMETLRREPLTASIPVHFVSALDAPERGLALGAIGFLTKPASVGQLQAVVAALAPGPRRRSARVLLVEDDVPMGDSLLGLLAAESVNAVRVTRARDALERLGQERFGCVILDLALPDMDGLQLLHELRSRLGAGMPAVVVYTARELGVAELRALEEYTESIVTKEGGASSERLLDEVRFFVRRLNDGVVAGRSGGPAAPEAGGVRLDGRVVLIADDDMRTVYALSALLRGRGADVLVADTGAAALQMLQRAPAVDAVLMDIMMPEMDGYEAMRLIRRDDRFGRLPVIALTAKVSPDEASRCQDAGADLYLPKPVDGDRLLAALHQQLAPQRAPEAA